MNTLEVIQKSMVENVDDWEQAGHYLVNTKNGLKVWTGNGLLFYDTYPESNAFNFLDKIKFSIFRRKWNALKLNRVLLSKDEE